MRKSISLDLRERIVEAYERKEGTREEVAKRFKVSLGLVKKLLQQQSRTGDLRPRYRFCGRKARLMPEHGAALKALIAREPDVTLAEMKARLGLDCTVAAIHQLLAKLGLTYKKRRSMRLGRAAPISHKRSGAKTGSTRLGWSSSTSRPPKRT